MAADPRIPQSNSAWRSLVESPDMSDWIESARETSVINRAEPPPSSSEAALRSELWEAGQLLISAEPEERALGFKRLLDADPDWRQPLTLYLLVSRIREPDLNLRCEILSILGSIVSAGAGADLWAREARAQLSSAIRRCGRDEVVNVLQALAHSNSALCSAVTLPHAAQLLENVAGAFDHLTRIASDRYLPAAVRSAAVEVIGEIGYLDALPLLEGLQSRLEGRRAGQLSMAFAPQDDPDEGLLLPAVKVALEALRDSD